MLGGVVTAALRTRRKCQDLNVGAMSSGANGRDNKVIHFKMELLLRLRSTGCVSVYSYFVIGI